MAKGLPALGHFSFICARLRNQARKHPFRLAELVLTLISCFSFSENCYKQISGVAMGTKLGLSYANPFLRLHGTPMSETAPNLNSTVATWTTVWTLLLLPERNSINLINCSQFYPALKYTWEISDDIFSAFLIAYHSFYRSRRFMHQCALQTHRFP